jgi:hypothetical protein
MIGIGSKVKGEYHGVAFTGIVRSMVERFSEPYFEVEFDRPLVIRGSARTGVCMYRTNKCDFLAAWDGDRAEELAEQVARLVALLAAIREQAEAWSQPQHTSDRQDAARRLLALIVAYSGN